MVGAHSGAPRSAGDVDSRCLGTSADPIVEGFAVETKEGLIFTVKGLHHPPEHLVAYLRYAPDLAGERMRAGVRYRRLYHFDEQEAFLERRHPDYIYDDPVLGLRLQSVPRTRVSRVFDPCRRLAALREQGPHDRSEETVLELDELVRTHADVSALDLGISGSIMVGLHQTDSDIDLIVYGERAGREVHGALSRLLRARSGPIRRPNDGELRALHAIHQVDTPLSYEAFRRMQGRKVNELRFRGRETFLRFVRRLADVDGSCGDERYEALGTATIEAYVGDDDLAIFTPCRYGLKGVSILRGVVVEDLRIVISFRGRFSDQAVRGEAIEARGSVERVIPRDGGLPYHRLVVGGRPGHYLVARETKAQVS